MSGFLAGLAPMFAPAAGAATAATAGAATAGLTASTAAAAATTAATGATGGLLGSGGLGSILAGLSQGLMSWAEMSYQARLEREKEERAIARNEGISGAMDWYAEDNANPVGSPQPSVAASSSGASQTRSVGREYKAKAERAASNSKGRYSYNAETRKIETK